MDDKPSPQRLILDRICQLEHMFNDWYDRNDEIGPFNDAMVLEGEQYFDENMLSDHATDEGPTISKVRVIYYLVRLFLSFCNVL